MQQKNYVAAEVVYRKAQEIEPDANKACNLSLCLVRQRRYEEARAILDDARGTWLPGSDDPKILKRAEELLHEIDSLSPPFLSLPPEDLIGQLELLTAEWSSPVSRSRRRLPIFEEISTFRDHQIAC